MSQLPFSSMDLHEGNCLPDTEWLSPDPNNMYALNRVCSERNGDISEEDIINLASGRYLHLGRLTYPNGFEAVRVIDSETEIPIHRRDGMDQEYYVDPVFKTGSLRQALTGRMPNMGGKRELKEFWDTGLGILSIIGVAGQERPSDKRERSELRINPSTNRVELDAAGSAPNIPKARAQVSVNRGYGRAWANLAIWKADSDFPNSSLDIGFDADGIAERTFVNGKAVLKMLGIKLPFGTMRSGDKLFLKDGPLQARILIGLAEALGLDRWRPLDVAGTGRALYADLGKLGNDIKPTESLRF